MKTLIAITLLFSSWMAQATSLNKLAEGYWIVTYRVCLTDDGTAPATDAFDLKRDHMTLLIQKGKGSIDVDIDGKSTTRTFRIKGLGIFGPHGDVSTYGLTPDSQLFIWSADFGPGGTCKPGQRLLTTFEKGLYAR